MKGLREFHGLHKANTVELREQCSLLVADALQMESRESVTIKAKRQQSEHSLTSRSGDMVGVLENCDDPKPLGPAYTVANSHLTTSGVFTQFEASAGS